MGDMQPNNWISFFLFFFETGFLCGSNKWISMEVLWNIRIILKLCGFCVFFHDGSCKYSWLSPITHRSSRNHWKMFGCEWPRLRSTRGDRSNIFQWDFVLSMSINVCMKCLTRSSLMVLTLLAIFLGKIWIQQF